MFEGDDLDWAIGELLALFDEANAVGIYPHELNPTIFHDAWGLMCEQPFVVAQYWHRILMNKITRPLRHKSTAVGSRRYAYALPH